MKKLFFVLLLLSGLMAFGQPSHYLTFNGVDQYMSIPHHPDFNIDSDFFEIINVCTIEDNNRENYLIETIIVKDNQINIDKLDFE